jgi:hypothetical protein
LPAGEGVPPLNGLLSGLLSEPAKSHPEFEIDVHEGRQARYPLLLCAE